MDLKITREMEERRSTRRNLVKSASRSDKIRTYNFAQVMIHINIAPISLIYTLSAQERVTDHRIGLTMKNLTSVLEGDGIQVFIDGVNRDHAESVMEQLLEESDSF